jgi:hypothetical protein
VSEQQNIRPGLHEIHEACCGTLAEFRAAGRGESNPLIQVLTQVKAELEEELAAAGEHLRDSPPSRSRLRRP